MADPNFTGEIALPDFTDPNFSRNPNTSVQGMNIPGMLPNSIFNNVPAGTSVAPKIQPASGKPIQRSSEAVKNMQIALVNLSKTIAGDIPLGEKADQPGSEHTEGSDSFLNFLVNSYMNKAKLGGKQMLNTNIHQPDRMGPGSAPNTNFKSVIESLQHIGSPNSKEQEPDGVWGPRTTNALEQVYALAHSVSQVQKDMGISVSGYGDADLEQLHANITDIKVSSDQRATAIQKNLQKFDRAYTDFRDKVLHNNFFKGFITQDKPLVSLNKDKPQLSPEQTKSLETYKNTQIPTKLNQTQVAIAPKDLRDMSSFKTYLKTVGDQIGIPQDQLNEAITSDAGAMKYLPEIIEGLKQG